MVLKVEKNRRQRLVVVVSGEVFKTLLYRGGDVTVQRYLSRNGLHLRRVVAQQLLLYGGAVLRLHHHHIYVEIGNDERIAVQVCQYDCVIHYSFLISELNGAWRAVHVCLWLRLKIRSRVSAQMLFEWVWFVGSAFLPASGLSSLCHATNKLKM